MDIDKLAVALGEVWGEQIAQQQLWHNWSELTKEGKELLLKELLLGLHEETAELQRFVDQSRFHLLKNCGRVDVQTVAEHGVDVFKFLVALMALCGVEPQTFAHEFVHKSKVVELKWKWECQQLADIEVLACDLDGCVADWASGFMKWCETRGFKTVNGLDDQELEPLKDQFHELGGFSTLRAMPDAARVLNNWRRGDSHRQLVFITARPYKRYRRVYADTLDWLAAAGLFHDHILFERDKADAIRSLQPARVVAMVEDRGRHALEVAACGIRVLKLPYNGSAETVDHPLITHVVGWGEIESYLYKVGN